MNLKIKIKMKKMSVILAAISLAAFSQSVNAQDHGHLNVGAVSTSQNAQLTFDNGADFATNVDYVYTLSRATNGTYNGYFQGNITLTALAATTAHSGPIPNAPALGSFIYAQLVGVDGPAGGAFGFWESGATNPTIQLACGTTGTNTWNLSQNNGAAGTDPYGHIHGRRFTATQPGFYTVSFRALDFSTNGTGGGAIHTASDILKIYFQAGINIQSIEPDDDHTHVRFGAKLGTNWIVQATSSLSATNWQDVGTPQVGNDYIKEVLDETPVEGMRFFRVKSSP